MRLGGEGGFEFGECGGMRESNAFHPTYLLHKLLIELGFQERIRGSHHIFTKDGVIEILNLQPKGSKAKVYQVKQVREVILKYRLGGSNDNPV